MQVKWAYLKDKGDIMQHEMERQQEEQNQLRSSSAYEGERARPPQAYHIYGQKLAGSVSSQAPTAGQRLALAIVSLSLLVFLIFGLILFAAANNAPSWAVIPILFIMILFSAVATTINLIFNRRA